MIAAEYKLRSEKKGKEADLVRAERFSDAQMRLIISDGCGLD